MGREAQRPPLLPGAPSTGARSNREVRCRLVLILVALAGLRAAQGLSGASGLSLGPGTVPRLYSGLLGVCGAAILLSGLRQHPAPIRPVRLRPAACVIGAILLFAVLVKGARTSFFGGVVHVPALGLLMATFVVCLVAAGASREGSWPGRAAVGAVIAIIIGTLAHLLGLPLPLWPDLP